MSLGDKARIIRAISENAMSIQEIVKKTKLDQETVFTIVMLYQETFERSTIDEVAMFKLTPQGLTLLPAKKEMKILPPPNWYLNRIASIKKLLKNSKEPLTTRQIADFIKKDRVHTFKLLSNPENGFKQVGKSKKNALWQTQ